MGSGNGAGVNPSAFEVAADVVWGSDAPYAVGSPAEVSQRAALEPLVALEDIVARSLTRPPCIVTFSGGRDSSAILAVATHVARREGLPLPIPATFRLPEIPSAEESAWQERVIAHLRLDDWHRTEYTTEIELLGPIARRVLLRHGQLFPSNAHLHAPPLELARGGALLTGIFGDQVFDAWTYSRPWTVLRGRASPEPRDVLRWGYVLAPGPLRLAVARRRARSTTTPWLTARARAVAVARSAADHAAQPRRFDRWLLWLNRSRYLSLACRGWDAMARAENAAIAHPFLDTGFLSALGRRGGRAGWPSREAVMSDLFRELLPADVLARTTKAVFPQAFFGPETRRFITAWEGEGIDRELVDPAALGAVWSNPDADGRALMRTQLLTQSTWLDTEGRRAHSAPDATAREAR